MHRLRHPFRSLGYRNFRLFFAGQSISLLGTWIQRIATPWLVYHLTHSVFLLGLVGFVGQVPVFLVSPFAGVLSDRWNRYRILMATQILAMLQATILAALVLSGSVEILHILLLSGFLGCVNAFDIPSRQSLLIQMVEKKEDLGNAIALNSTMVNAARLLGPSVAGLVIATTGEGLCFLLNAVSYGFVIVSLLLMKIRTKEKNKAYRPILTELKEGIAYAFGNRPIRYIILLLALVSLAGMPYAVLMPAFVKEALGGGATSFGFLMGASGMGALSGALYLAWRSSAAGLEKIIPLAAGVFGLGLVLLSFSRHLPIALPLMVITGLGMMLLMASSNTMLQSIVDDAMRGRVMSFFAMAIMGTSPFGSLLAGYVANHIGVPHTLLIGGICCMAGSFAFGRRFSKIAQAFVIR